MRKVFITLALVILTSAVLIALAVSDEVIKDPVCGMEVNPEEVTCKIEGTSTLYFCSKACCQKFCAEPTAYLSQEELDELEILAEGVINPETIKCALEEAEKCSGCEPEASEIEAASEEVIEPEPEAASEEVEEPETEAVSEEVEEVTE